MTREGFTLDDAEGRQRALAVLFGFLNRVQQEAMGIDFYVWTTQRDGRVREGHAERDDMIFRWDDPPEGGHPSEDFGCRCYARALGMEGYWERVKDSVDAFTFELETWEGNVDHLYLDSRDNVTVGKGKMLPDVEAAVELSFQRRDTDEPATEEEIRSEYELVDSMDGSVERRAEYYRPFTGLYLSQDDIDALVADHVREDFRALLRLYPGFGNFPLSARIALWDMIYNLGPGGLEEFQNMRRAVLDGDWETAAEESERSGISPERNQFVFDLFMAAAEDE
jgi:GH24 family phage-related lysozyme (muramidase)